MYFTAPANLQEVMIISSQVSGEQGGLLAKPVDEQGRKKSAQSPQVWKASEVDFLENKKLHSNS